MTKESLMALGLTEEQAAKVMEGLNGSFVTKTRFNEVNEEYDNKKTTVTAAGASGKTRKFSSREAAVYQQYWAGYTGGTLRDAWTILPIVQRGKC